MLRRVLLALVASAAALSAPKARAPITAAPAAIRRRRARAGRRAADVSLPEVEGVALGPLPPRASRWSRRRLLPLASKRRRRWAAAPAHRRRLPARGRRPRVRAFEKNTLAVRRAAGAKALARALSEHGRPPMGARARPACSPRGAQRLRRRPRPSCPAPTSGPRISRGAWPRRRAPGARVALGAINKRHTDQDAKT